MSAQDKVKDEWVNILRLMLRNFRAMHPGNAMSDKELLDAMMMSYNRAGLVGMAGGKWVLPQIDNPAALIASLEADYAEITAAQEQP